MTGDEGKVEVAASESPELPDYEDEKKVEEDELKAEQKTEGVGTDEAALAGLAEAAAALLSRPAGDLWKAHKISMRSDGYVMFEELFGCETVRPNAVKVLPAFADSTCGPDKDDEFPKSALFMVKELLGLQGEDGKKRFEAYDPKEDDFGGWLRVPQQGKDTTATKDNKRGGEGWKKDSWGVQSKKPKIEYFVDSAEEERRKKRAARFG